MLNDFIVMPIPVILLVIVFLLTAIRKIGNVHFPIWLIVSVAAITVLLTRQISLDQAYHAIDFDIIFYLLGVFVIGAALEQSNYLEYAMLHLFKKAKTGTSLLVWLIGFSAASTILLMNDTVAIIGAPAILLLCKKTDIPPLPLLLTLAFTLTLSSVTSPIANPQNLLIANQLPAPFISFVYHLFIPTVVNAVLLFIYIRLLFYRQFNTTVDLPEPELEIDNHLAYLAKISVSLMLLLIAAQISLSIPKAF